MARTYQGFAKRGEAVNYQSRLTWAYGEEATIYVVKGAAPFYLVGPPSEDVDLSGAAPLVTMVPGLPETLDRDLTISVLEDRIAVLSVELLAQARETREWQRKCERAYRTIHIQEPRGGYCSASRPRNWTDLEEEAS